MMSVLSCHRPAQKIYRAFAALLAAFFLSSIVAINPAAAAVYGGFSMGAGEEYTNNLYFSTQPGKEHVNDWITHFVPTFSLLYATPGDPTPVLTATLTPEGQVYAHNSRLNNFAENLSFESAYTFKASPVFTINFADNLNRLGLTRTIGLQAMGPPPQLPVTPTDLPSLGSFVPLPLVQGVENLVSKGRSLTNSLSMLPVYQYSPVLTFTGGYSLGYSNGNNTHEFTHTVGARGVYNWRQEHNLFAGYTVTIFDSHHHTTIIHSIDIGDDFFSNLKIRLTPTWTLSGAFGLSFNTGGTNLPAVIPNLNLTLQKVWQDSILNFSIRRGLSTSLGLFSGPSTTTTFSAGYGIRITERLTGLVGADYSLLGEKAPFAEIEVFRASAGLQYWITSWLSSNLWYSRRWRSAEKSAVDVPGGRAGANNVLASITAHFDMYPNPGLARGGINRPLFAPGGTPTYERTELQQPLRPDLGRPELQQPSQQPLREPTPPPKPKPEESKPPETETPPTP
jgi:hypothetical protein